MDPLPPQPDQQKRCIPLHSVGTPLSPPASSAVGGQQAPARWLWIALAAAAALVCLGGALRLHSGFTSDNAVPSSPALAIKKASPESLYKEALALLHLQPAGRMSPDDEAFVRAATVASSETLAEVVAKLRAAAEADHPLSQFAMAVLCIGGTGVDKDEAQAVGWFLKAAEQGNAQSQRNLGFMYGTGRGVPTSDALAVHWFRKSAEQGDDSAQYSLGVMYDTGRGLPKDEAQGAAWYRKAAEQGHVWAQFNLGLMYATGQGVLKDDSRAAAYFLGCLWVA